MVFPTPPAYDGSKVVFRGDDDNQQAGYYAVPAVGGAIAMLVNRSTIVPSGGGTFGAAGLTTNMNLSGSTFVSAVNRVFVRFTDAGNVTRRSTSLAVTTQ